MFPRVNVHRRPGGLRCQQERADEVVQVPAGTVHRRGARTGTQVVTLGTAAAPRFVKLSHVLLQVEIPAEPLPADPANKDSSREGWFYLVIIL